MNIYSFYKIKIQSPNILSFRNLSFHNYQLIFDIYDFRIHDVFNFS